MGPRFTVSCAANLPGVLHSLEPCIIGDEKMRRRNNVVKFRLSDDELAELQQKVEESGLNRNAFLVRMIRHQTIYPADKLSELNVRMDALLVQLRGMATNLNQITKLANMGKVDAINLTETSEALTETYQAVYLLARTNGGANWQS